MTSDADHGVRPMIQAERTVPAPSAQRGRPNPFQWLAYAFGAGLPDDLSEWVYRDTTGPTWVMRHLARGVLQLAPFVAATLLFLPGAFWIRGVAAVAASGMGLLFCLAYMVETTDHRLVKAGFDPGTGERVRHQRDAGTRTRDTAARLDRIAERQDRRRARHAH
jgi:hypothetical protein